MAHSWSKEKVQEIMLNNIVNYNRFFNKKNMLKGIVNNILDILY